MVIANTNATYGVTEGYTLPLKASTVYEFKFKYAGWGECGTPTIAILKGSETIKSTPLSAPAKTGNNNTDAWEAASVVFQTTDAGDYKVRFSTADGRDAFGDLELKKTPATVSATIGSYQYATFSSTYPVNVDVEGLEAYIATSSNGSSVTMQKVTGDVAAGIGLVLKGAAGNYSLPVVASGEWYNTTTDPKNYLFAVNEDYNLTAAGEGGTNYVLSVQSETVVWAPIGATAAPVKAGQAALWIPSGGTSSARALRMTFSGITDVENVEAAVEATVKNGAYLENGKIAIYKNGMKFSATGAKLK